MFGVHTIEGACKKTSFRPSYTLSHEPEKVSTIQYCDRCVIITSIRIGERTLQNVVSRMLSSFSPANQNSPGLLTNRLQTRMVHLPVTNPAFIFGGTIKITNSRDSEACTWRKSAGQFCFNQPDVELKSSLFVR